MKLIGSLASPYVRKVRVVFAEKKLDYTFILEDVWAANTTIGQTSALGKVPALLMDDGSVLFDSRVIVEYLDTLTPAGAACARICRANRAVRPGPRGAQAWLMRC